MFPRTGHLIREIWTYSPKDNNECTGFLYLMSSLKWRDRAELRLP